MGTRHDEASTKEREIKKLTLITWFRDSEHNPLMQKFLIVDNEIISITNVFKLQIL